MTFLADESIDRQIVDALRKKGHDVWSIAENSPGIPDDQVLSRANALRATLLTADKDFGELVFRQHHLHSGVILIRLAGHVSDVKAEIVLAAIEAHSQEFRRGFSVVTGRSIRIRRTQI